MNLAPVPSASLEKAGGKSLPQTRSWKLVMRPERGLNPAFPLIPIAWKVGGSSHTGPLGWHPTSQESILTTKWGWNTYLLGGGCAAAKIQETGAWEKALPNFEWPCSRHMGPNRTCQRVWLKKLPFLYLVKFRTELGCESLSLGKPGTARAHAELQSLAQGPSCPPMSLLPLVSSRSATAQQRCSGLVLDTARCTWALFHLKWLTILYLALKFWWRCWKQWKKNNKKKGK